MRIVHFNPNLISRGKERRLLELIKFQSHDKKNDVTLVLFENKIEYDIKDINFNLIFLERKKRFSIKLFFSLITILNTIKPDIVHSWNTMTTFYLIFIKPFVSFPIVNNQISTKPLKPYRLNLENILIHFNIIFSNVVLANSYAGKESYHYKKIKVIHNGINLNRFKIKFNAHSFKKKYQIGTKKVILMVGHFNNQKNWKLFVDLAEKYFNKKIMDVSFIGIGYGEDYVHYNTLLKQKKLENIRLIGKINEVEKFIFCSSICILLTKSEGISNFILESMAMRKVIITTDIIGGSSEVIVNNFNGYLSEPNLEKLFLLTNSIIKNKKLQRKIGNNAFKSIELNFSISKMGKSYNKIYKSLLYAK